MTNEARMHRNLSDTDLCQRCGASCEFALHALKDCPLVASMWKLLVKPSILAKFFRLNLLEWISLNLSNNIGVDAQMHWDGFFGTSCWYVWKQRNNWVFNNKREEALALIPLIEIQVKDLNDSLLLNHGPMDDHSWSENLRWKAPPNDWVKINVDGSHMPTNDRIACGGLARNSNGSWLVIIETDSSSAIELAQYNHSSPSLWSALVHRIQVMRSKDWSTIVTHTPRENNHVADLLAKSALSSPLGVSFLVRPPEACK
ncbi:ribonuclease H [Senna tora]|uniref:Ribonuclease H n=1 Tax=Senna tora TaxID=362788 RepID=A0A834SYX9_9FABA|nr:ribonuclease H [Senna tora]